MEVTPEGGKASGQKAVTELGRIMSEREKYKRLMLFSFVILWVIAVLVPVFAPKDRVNVSLLASGALIILSFGIIGAKNFIFKALGLSIKVSDRDTSEENNSHVVPIKGNNEQRRGLKMSDPES